MENEARMSPEELRRRILEAQKKAGGDPPADGAVKGEKANIKSAKSDRPKIKRSKSKRSKIKCASKATAGKKCGVREFFGELRYDVDAIMQRDPAARSRAEAVLLYSGFHALAAHRVAHALNERGAHFSARLISQATKMFTGIEIHPGATIGRGLFIDHGSGVVIGETTIIGDDCTIYQGATLGGTGKETGKRHPTLGDRVMVGAGAKLLGNFTVGSGSKIAAGAVVLADVPENSTDLDQTHIPDPVAIRMDEMQAKLDELTRRVVELTGGEAPGESADEA